MNRKELEHIIRASSAISNDYKIIIIGSQSILGGNPNAPLSLLQSMEADVYPMNIESNSDIIIDGSIGEESLFHKTFGYYAKCVSKETAVLPENWKT